MGKTQSTGNLTNGISQDSSNNIGIGAAPSGTYKFEVTGTAKISGVATFGSTLSNGTYSYTLPSATGTLALTSALGDYLPLTGGTLTGALIGTQISVNTTNATGKVNIQGPNDSGLLYLFNSSANARFMFNNYYGYGIDAMIIQEFNTSNVLQRSIISFQAGGNVLIGTTTDSGYKLDVNGTGRFSSSVTATEGKFSLDGGTEPTYTTGTAGKFIKSASGIYGGVRVALVGGSAGGDNGFDFYNTTTLVGQFGYGAGGQQFYFTKGVNMATTSGNVGIGGVTSPQAKLEVGGSIMSSGSDAAAQANKGVLDFNTGNTRLISFGPDTSTQGGFQFLTLASNGTGNTAMTITSGGNVGIGTSSPVDSGTTTKTLQIGGTTIIQSVVGNQTLYGDNVYYTTGTGWRYVTTSYASGIRIGALAAGEITFHCAPSGTAGGLMSTWDSTDIKMVIQRGGNVGIGTVSPSAKLEVSQSDSATWSTIVRIAPSTGACYGVLSTIQNQSPNNTSSFLYYGDDNTAARFIVYSNGGIANYTANNNPLSDERLKKEITPLESVWDKVKAIEVVKYKFNDQTHDDFNMGVIAQQVEMVAPELVNLEGWGTLAEDGTPYKSIWENDMNYYTMKALQEAMTKIEEQQIQIQNLQEQINILAK